MHASARSITDLQLFSLASANAHSCLQHQLYKQQLGCQVNVETQPSVAKTAAEECTGCWPWKNKTRTRASHLLPQLRLPAQESNLCCSLVGPTTALIEEVCRDHTTRSGRSDVPDAGQTTASLRSQRLVALLSAASGRQKRFAFTDLSVFSESTLHHFYGDGRNASACIPRLGQSPVVSQNSWL